MKTFYCMENKATGEQFGFAQKRAFAQSIANELHNLPDAIKTINFLFLNSKGEKSTVCPYELAEWYQETQAAIDEKFINTHHKIYVKMGITPWAAPRSFWVKN